MLPKVPTDSQQQIHCFLHVLRVFAVETASRLEDWGYVLATIKVGHIAVETGMVSYSQVQEATRADDQTLITFEAFCDILVSSLAIGWLCCKLIPTNSGRTRPVQLTAWTVH